MRFISIIIIGLISCITCYGQIPANDSLITSLYDDVDMIKCFEALSQSSEMDSLEAKLGFRFCNIASCVNPFSINYLTGPDRELIKLRLEEIAERFVKNGTPILLILGGHSGGDYANELNTKKNEFNVRNLSTGNYCQVTETEKYFEEAFNSRTRKLIGLDN